MTTTTYRFTGPSTTRRHKGTCPGCGKKVTRSRTFQHTVNPWNRHPTENRPKTWDEVRAGVKAEADAWKPDFRCQSCQFIDWVNGMAIETLRSWIRSDSYERDDAIRDGKPKRATNFAERIAAYEARIRELETVTTEEK